MWRKIKGAGQNEWYIEIILVIDESILILKILKNALFISFIVSNKKGEYDKTSSREDIATFTGSFSTGTILAYVAVSFDRF